MPADNISAGFCDERKFFVERLESESYKKRKIIVAVALSLIVMCIIMYLKMVVFAAPAPAGSPTTPDDESLGFSSFAEWLTEPIKTLLRGELIQGICSRYFNDDIRNIILRLDIWNPIITFFKGIGILICFFNMMVKIIKTCEKGEMTSEQFIGVFLTLAIPCMLIFEYDKVVDAVSKVANYLFVEIMNHTQTVDLTQTGLTATINDLVKANSVEFSIFHIGDWLAGTTTGIITWLALTIANFIMGIQIISSIISLYMNIVIRYIYMPISIANVAEEGPRSTGMKYILKYIAAHAHVASIMLITQILMNTYVMLIAAFNTEGQVIKLWELLFIWLCLPAALKSGISMSGEAIKEAFGVGMM